MQTNRLIFKDNDLSFSIPQPSGLQGYMVVRAPKGTTTPTYIEANNTNAILELFGSPSSSFSGIKEVIDFNKNFGTWISAPAGVHSGSSNSFGGVYLTTEGSVEPFTSSITESSSGEPNIDYMAGWTVKNQANTGISPFVNGVTLSYDNVGEQLVVGNIQSKYFNTGKIGTITVSFPKKSLPTDSHLVTFYLPSGGTNLHVSPAGTNTCGTITGTTTLTMNITGDTAETAALYTDLQDAVYMATLVAGDIKVSWTQNIQDNTIMSFYQNSIRNTAGTFTLNSVDLRPVVVNPMSSGISISNPILVTPLTSTFTVSGVSSTITPTTPQIIKVGSVAVVITSTDNATTNGIASKIAAASYGSGWTVTANNNIVTITATTPIIEDSRSNPNYNTLSFTYRENSYASIYYQKSFTVSTDLNNTTPAGESRYVQDVIGSNNFIRAVVNKQIYDTASGVIWSASTSTIAGFRIVDSSVYSSSTDLAPTLQQGWDLAGLSLYEDVSLFIDPEFCDSVIPTFASLRGTSSPFSTFVSGLRITNAAATTLSDNTKATNDLVSKRAGLPSLTGLAYYCNELYTSESYTGTSFWTIPVGAMASMLGNIMVSWMGGKAPMWVNENNVGGQIVVSSTKQKFSFSADMLDTLDAAGINPIIRSNEYGVMATSQKTSQDSANLTDWSFLGHQMAFDLFKKEMRSSVMIPQIGKAIDTNHMEIRQRQATVILDKRTKGNSAIWDSGAIYIKEVNTADTKLQNNFIIKARVKVNPFSEYVTLILENIPQTGTV